MTWFAIGIAVFLAIGGWVALIGPPYVPALKKDLKKAFDELYVLTSKDVLLDLGSGDGTVLREAARRGAKAVGYEINPLLVLLSKALGSRLKTTTQLANAWTKPFPDDTTVVYAFAERRDVTKVSRAVQREANRLGRDIAVLSYGFALPGLEQVGKKGAHYKFVAKPLQP